MLLLFGQQVVVLRTPDTYISVCNTEESITISSSEYDGASVILISSSEESILISS